MVEDKVNIEQKMFDFIEKNTYSDITKVNSQTKLFREGIFDSMSFVLLIDFVEEGFDIKASNDDLVERNFESITAIADFIIRKKNGKAL
jgi:acyl carrier protein